MKEQYFIISTQWKTKKVMITQTSFEMFKFLRKLLFLFSMLLFFWLTRKPNNIFLYKFYTLYGCIVQVKRIWYLFLEWKKLSSSIFVRNRCKKMTRFKVMVVSISFSAYKYGRFVLLRIFVFRKFYLVFSHIEDGDEHKSD